MLAKKNLSISYLGDEIPSVVIFHLLDKAEKYQVKKSYISYIQYGSLDKAYIPGNTLIHIIHPYTLPRKDGHLLHV